MPLKLKHNMPDARKFSLLIDTVDREFRAGSMAELRLMAEMFVTELRDVILRQRRPWMPLSRDYAAYKKDAELDPRTLIATPAEDIKGVIKTPYKELEHPRYVDAIRILETTIKDGNKGERVQIRVGVPNEPHDPHDLDSIKLPLLAAVLEFGSVSRGIPPRPHWRPVASKFWKLNREHGTKILKHLYAIALRKIQVARWPIREILK